MGFTLETIPAMHYDMNITRLCQGKNEEETVTLTKTVAVLEYLDYVCTAFFTLELIIRLIFAPNKLNFIRDLMNIIDILALLPLYVQIIMEQTDKFNCHVNNRAVLETIFILRIIRIFRIFHLVKHYRALKILIHAIRASVQELLMLSIFLVIAMLVFATLIFYAERDPNSETLGFYGGDFGTIPIGFWWATITMTTVGYGDIYPETPMGMAIGSLCAVWGVLLLALTIPVISNNFALFYTHARTRERITSKDRARKQSEDETANAHVMHSRTPSAGHVDKVKLFKGLESKALLINVDSNSTTEETGLMMGARNMDCDSMTSTPQKNTANNVGNNKAESAMWENVIHWKIKTDASYDGYYGSTT